MTAEGGPEAADVVVVGAGPAGLAAAEAAAERGCAVLLLDSQPEPGGQIWRAAARAGEDRLRRAVFGKAADTARAAIRAAERRGMRMAPAADVIDVTPDRTVVWLDRAAGPTMRQTRARALILATGAQERPVVFPGAGLPGVFGVGALQIAVKQGAMVPEGPVVLVGQGPLLLLTLAQLRAFGAAVAALAAPGPAMPPTVLVPDLLRGALGSPGLIARGLGLAARQALSGVRVLRGVRALEALGGDRLEAVRITGDRGTEEIPCGVLGVHDGVVPETQLARLMGLEHRWDAATECFVPAVDGVGRTSAEGVWAAGDGAGIAGWKVARLSGRLAGLDAAHSLGAGRAPPSHLHDRIARARPARRFLEALYPPLPVDALATDAAILCHCEGVSVGAARTAIREGATGPNRVKTATRCGMGPCQGRMCGLALTRLIAAETGRSGAEVGALRIRPPLKPVLAADYATLVVGAAE